MPSDDIIVCGDGHFHLYPCYDPARSFAELIRNLDALVENRNLKVSAERDAHALPNGFRSSKVGQRPSAFAARQSAATARRRPAVPSDLTGISFPDQKQEIFRLAFLTEGGQFDYFQKIAAKEIVFAPVGLEVSAGPEEHCLSFSRDGKLLLVLIAGRQIATAERLEILGLGVSAKIPDGVEAAEAIEKILSSGGAPVLPFSPGKWLFKRAGIVGQLAEKYGGKLAIGDSALRPLGWGEPEVMIQARKNHLAVLAGSDPLPLAGEEKYAGCYGFVYQGPFDNAKPLTAIREIIANKPQALTTAGRRRSLVNVAISLLRLRINAECKMQNAKTKFI